MKNTFLGVAALLFASCTPSLKVDVTNATMIERDDETVTIAWSELASLKTVNPENIVVTDDDGEQVPSQVIFYGQNEPQSLIFQADVDAMETERFSIRTGVREQYRTEAFGRAVPERFDDYAWENNKVAYRLYGPALETAEGQLLVTPGIDVWVKCREKLVIDEWYAKRDYHHNYGDGMDCYKVGLTLGGGASAPFVDGKLWLSRNYATQQTLDNGPIRTTVKLTYAPFDVNGTAVSLTKIISLDANQRFNRMENIYEGVFSELPIAAGFVRHDVKTVSTGEGWMALCEATSDTKDPVRDGDIYVGIILPEAQMLPDSVGHALAVKSVKAGQPLTYYAGTGWSQGGIDDMAEWLEKIEEQQAAVLTPLSVVIRK
ncbi:MAG: DUF4861 family protein [Alistipes sp.]